MTCGVGTRTRVGNGPDCTQPSTEECSDESCKVNDNCLFVLLMENLCVMCSGNATHLANFGVTVTQHPRNTDRPSRPKGLMIDGQPTTVNGQSLLPGSTCASTDPGDNPWVRLDFKKAYLVSLVRAIIYGTTAQNVVVRVGSSLTNNGNDNHQCGMVGYVYGDREKAVWKDVPCSPPVWGRYINFDRTKQNHRLEICEVTFRYGQCILCCH